MHSKKIFAIGVNFDVHSSNYLHLGTRTLTKILLSLLKGVESLRFLALIIEIIKSVLCHKKCRKSRQIFTNIYIKIFILIVFKTPAQTCPISPSHASEHIGQLLL